MSTEEISLEALAKDINAAHSACVSAAHDALGHAYRAGTALLKAKAQVDHGKWIDWVGRNCKFSERTGQRYIQVACRLDEPNTTRASFSSIREVLAKPEEADALSQMLRINARMERQVRFCEGLLPQLWEEVESATDPAELIRIDRRMLTLQNNMSETRLRARRACARVLAEAAESIGVTQDDLLRFVRRRLRADEFALSHAVRGGN